MLIIDDDIYMMIGEMIVRKTKTMIRFCQITLSRICLSQKKLYFGEKSRFSENSYFLKKSKFSCVCVEFCILEKSSFCKVGCAYLEQIKQVSHGKARPFYRKA